MGISMADFIVIAIIVVIVGCATAYVVKAKKNGAKCIGCPAAGKCSGKNHGKASDSPECSCGCGGKKGQ